VAAHLPTRTQQSLKRRYFASLIRGGRFITDEPEFALSSELIGPGDWVIDVGANIGHYTLEFARLVGGSGRVIAFEPVPETFELLAANVAYAETHNVTLLNAAASDATAIVGMDIPKFETGLDNYYMASVSEDAGGLSILTLPIDALDLPQPIRLVKIDAEGHDFAVLRGMERILRKDRPVIFIEAGGDPIAEFLAPIGYTARRLPGSHNTIFE